MVCAFLDENAFHSVGFVYKHIRNESRHVVNLGKMVELSNIFKNSSLIQVNSQKKAWPMAKELPL